jgi:hypothetical protein
MFELADRLPISGVMAQRAFIVVSTANHRYSGKI